MSFLPYRKFLALSRQFNLIPVYEEYLEDVQTPVSTYLKIKSAFKGPSFLLESAETGLHSGRFSFIGLDPWMVYKGGLASGRLEFKNGTGRLLKGPPTRVLFSLLSQYTVPELPELHHFYGGAVGYFAYDTVRSLEKLGTPPPDDTGVPDCLAMFPDTIIIFDHWRSLSKIVVLTDPGDDPAKAYTSARQKIDRVKSVVNNVLPAPHAGRPGETAPELIDISISRNDYLKQVEKAINYIRSGDILQVVLSRRYSLPLKSNPLDVFRRLRSLNPSPYMFFMDFEDPVILGASPEMLVRVTGETACTRPIAGTRPRSSDPQKDRELERDLLADEKERAEHLMLVDLGRNDLGRISVPGSVEVPGFMRVERFSHVMHLVSDVKSVLRAGTDPLAALEACFPAGTVSGAPKIRAMEIIDELEPCRRGVYAGAVGYAGFGNLLDTAIAIRTLVISRNRAHIQAGGGIVADSVPEAEYMETVNKAGALFQALGLEEEWRSARGIHA